jgi:hypothetical protein
LTTPLFSTGIGLVRLGFQEETVELETTREGAGRRTRKGAGSFWKGIKVFFEEEVND